jgi:hypothetical protein
MNDVFIPIYYPITNYAKKPLNSIEKMWFGDMANVRVGPGRIRQVRMKKGNIKDQRIRFYLNEVLHHV